MTEVSRLLRYSAIATVVLMLGGCSHALRNRNLDYLNQPIEQLPPLKVPQGITAPTLMPNNTLPPGPSDYPAVPAVLMTPPGYSQQYNPKQIPTGVPAVTVTPAAASSSTTQQTEQLAKLHQEVQAAQAKLNSLQKTTPPATTTSAAATPSMPPAPPVAMPAAPAVQAKLPAPAAPVTKPVATVPANTLVALPANDINPQPAMNPPVTTSAENMLPTVPATVPAATLLSLPTPTPAVSAAKSTPMPAKTTVSTTAQQPLSSTSSQDAADVTTLTVSASPAVVWAALPQAILNSGFVTVSTDAPHGFYYIVPQGLAAGGNTWMLSVQQQGQGATITPYDSSGAPAGSSQANTLMQYIQQHLMEP